jgi:hypothetical protein
MNKTKAKELIKEINYHIKRAEKLTKELNIILGKSAMPFETLKKLNVKEIFPKKKQFADEDIQFMLMESTEQWIEQQRIESGEYFEDEN